jgi:hypothetical protein
MPIDNEVTVWLQSYDFHTVLEHPCSTQALKTWHAQYSKEILEVPELALAKSVVVSKLSSGLFWICYSVNPNERAAIRIMGSGPERWVEWKGHVFTGAWHQPENSNFYSGEEGFVFWNW